MVYFLDFLLYLSGVELKTVYEVFELKRCQQILNLTEIQYLRK